jgi:hypothetical protein
MWYRLSKIKSLPTGQLYVDYSGESLQINPEEYFDFNYEFDNSYEFLPERESPRKFDLEADYPASFPDQPIEGHILIITAINKMNNEPAAEIKIIFPETQPKYAVVDDIKVLAKSGYKELFKTWNKDVSMDDVSYAKHGLGQMLYKKAVEWIKQNRPIVKSLAGFVSSKESYRARNKALGNPSYTRYRNDRKPHTFTNEQVENILPPSMFTTKGGIYDYDDQFEVRHDIKD